MNPDALTIRAAGPADAEPMAQLANHPRVFPGLMMTPYATEAVWRQRLASVDESALHLVACRGGQLTGSAGLLPTSVRSRRRHAASLYLMVAGDAQRQGVGRALMQALCDYADDWGHWQRLALTVFADNAAIALYDAFGFVTEGRHRAYALRAGRHEDVLAMARLHPRAPRLERP
jgi:putative acetyltransferase